jgi:c-di-GMP-binding flagellar brake protein YcgR
MLSSLRNDEIEDRYFLLGKMEILNVLNELIHRRELVTVYFNGGRDFLVTTLLEARPEALIFDLGGDDAANRKLPTSLTSVFVSRLDGIRIQFSATQAARFTWGDSDAFCIPLPERIVRLQRRESYRILLPVAKPVRAKVVSHDNLPLGEWPGHDLSVGGLGFNVIGEPHMEPGQTVRLHLPFTKKLVINCTAIVRHVTHIADRFDGPHYRVGVSFFDLPASTGVSIQRYILKIELERRGMRTTSTPGKEF